MDWMNSKLNQLILLGTLLATIAGVGWTGAELMGRLTTVEEEVKNISTTENSVEEIEKRFEAIDVTIKGLENSYNSKFKYFNYLEFITRAFKHASM